MRAHKDLLADLYAQLRMLLAAVINKNHRDRDTREAAVRVLNALSPSMFEQTLLGATKTYLGWSQHTRRAFFDRLTQLGHRPAKVSDVEPGEQEAAVGGIATATYPSDEKSVTAREKLWQSVLAHASVALEGQTLIKVQRKRADGTRYYEKILAREWSQDVAGHALFQHFVAGLEEECGCSLRLDPPLIQDSGSAVPPLVPRDPSRDTGPIRGGGANEIPDNERKQSPQDELQARGDLISILQTFGGELKAANRQAYFAARRWYWILRYSDEDKVNQEIARQMMRRDNEQNPSHEDIVLYTRDVVAPLLALAEARFQQFLAARGYTPLTRGDIKRALRS